MKTRLDGSSPFCYFDFGTALYGDLYLYSTARSKGYG